MSIEVVRTFLELRDRSALRPAPEPEARYSVRRQSPCSPATYRSLYESVGRPYHWRDRLAWSDDELTRHLTRADVSVWMLRDHDQPAGFFELVAHHDHSAEIAYFGLLGEYHGRGLGKFLLTRAVEEAWRAGSTRIWLHTCTLDGPAALPNYIARGFEPFRTETYIAHLPAPGDSTPA